MALTIVILYVILSYVFMGVIIRLHSPFQYDSSELRRCYENDAAFWFVFSPFTAIGVISAVIFECIYHLAHLFLIRNPKPSRFGECLRYWEYF